MIFRNPYFWVSMVVCTLLLGVFVLPISRPLFYTACCVSGMVYGWVFGRD